MPAITCPLLKPPSIHKMESSELYHVKQQFHLGLWPPAPSPLPHLRPDISPPAGAYKSLVDLTLPDPDSPDYTPTLIYKARANIALGSTAAAAALVPADTENLALKSVASLARYVGATSDDAREAALEELRDLSVEIEGEDGEATPWEKGVVRVLAGTAFVRAGEIEEALEILGAGNDTQNLEA